LIGNALKNYALQNVDMQIAFKTALEANFGWHVRFILAEPATGGHHLRTQPNI
jgi:hypothetical protein